MQGILARVFITESLWFLLSLYRHCTLSENIYCMLNPNTAKCCSCVFDGSWGNIRNSVINSDTHLAFVSCFTHLRQLLDITIWFCSITLDTYSLPNQMQQSFALLHAQIILISSHIVSIYVQVFHTYKYSNRSIQSCTCTLYIMSKSVHCKE